MSELLSKLEELKSLVADGDANEEVEEASKILLDFSVALKSLRNGETGKINQFGKDTSRLAATRRAIKAVNEETEASRRRNEGQLHHGVRQVRAGPRR